MKLQIIKIWSYGMIFIGLLLMAPSMSFGQNFANIVPVDTQENDLMDDKEIEEILNQQAAEDEAIGLASAKEDSGSSYTLGVMDVIEISVLRHPEVSGEFVVNKEGNIQYEFIGDVHVAGKTKKELTEHLTKILDKYIISPEVTVKIIGYNSKVVYVVGEVARPGKIYMRGDTITVREALIQAGLPLLSAKASKSKLITPADHGKAVQINVNVHDLLYKGDLRENLVMKPGDTLYVPATIMAKTMRIMQPIAAPIGTAASTGRTVTTGF